MAGHARNQPCFFHPMRDYSPSGCLQVTSTQAPFRLVIAENSPENLASSTFR